MYTEIDHLAGTDSAIHRMDPRLKLLGFACFLLATALVSSLAGAVMAFFLAGLWVAWSRFPLGFILRRVRLVVLFLSFFFLVLPFSHPLGLEAGLIQAAVILLKGTAMMLTIFPMFGTAPLDLSVKALERLKVSSRFLTMILFTFRYLSVYSDQLETLRVALTSRGFKPRADLFTIRIAGNLVGSLLVRSFEQTERLYRSMVCRGYRNRLVTLHEFSSLRLSDGYKVVLLLVMSFGLVLVDQTARGGGFWIR
jgi:cobalt/nickel transport system permease protein